VKVGIACYPSAGGSGVVATELGLALAERGHEVHLVSYAPPLRLEPDRLGAGGGESGESPVDAGRLRYHEVEVSSYPLFRYPPYDTALASRLAELADEEGLDLVHVHYAIPHALSALLAKEVVRPRRLPVVTTLHGTDITVVGQDRAYHRIARYAIQSSDAVTAVSEWLRGETDRVFGCTRPIDVVPNFVDLARFAPGRDGPRRLSYARPTQAILVHVSNFRPVKRTPAVVEVFARVCKARDAILVMAGDGPDRAACEARARALGVRDRVRFLGARIEVERLLPIADAFLLPSEFESFGLAALEAMACGTPPVAFASGGLPEVVTDGVDGVLCPPLDDEAMAKATLALLEDPAKREAMGRAGRATAQARFGRDEVVAAYERVYERVVTAPVDRSGVS
jgi:N-acetyl-alpha-D-glucosaminyl L-malate synthase BshA